MESERPESQSTSPGPSGEVNAGGDFVGRDKILYGDEVHGDKIVGDNFIKVLGNYIKSPRTFYEDLRTLVSEHPHILAVQVLLQGVLLFLFLRFKDRYLPSCWESQYPSCWDAYAILVLLLVVAAAGWIGAQRVPRLAGGARARYHLGWVAVAALAALAWTGLLIWQLWPIWHPKHFEADKFGIAIATFGTGSTFRATADGYEISSRIYRQLDAALTNDEESRSALAIMRIGVVGENSEQARRAGDIVGARLVVWGRLVRRGENVDIYFKVMQDPKLMDNPAYPGSIPVTEQAVENSITLAYAISDDVKEVVEQQSLGIAAFSLGLAQYHNRRFAEAARHFEDAIARFGEAPGANAGTVYPKQNMGLLYYYLGRCYQTLGRYEDSQAMYEVAERFNPTELAILLGKIYNHRVFGEEEARVETYRRIIALTDTRSDIQSRYNRGLAFDQIDEQESALDEFLSIIEEDANFYVAYLSAGNLLVEQDRLDEARKIYDDAARLAEGDRIRQIWLEIGRAGLYEKEGRIQEAIAATQSAIALDRDHSVTSLHYFLARLYAGEKRVEEAIASYETLIDVSPLPNWSHSVFADYLASEKQCEQAVEEFEEALKHPAYNHSVLYARLGLAYTCLVEQQEERSERQLASASKQKAVEAFELGVSSADCSERWVRHEYGRTLHQFGRLEEAIEQFNKALAPIIYKERACIIELGFEAKTLRNLGQLYEQKGDLAEARMRYEQVMALCEVNGIKPLLDRVGYEFLDFVKQQLEKLGGDTTRCFSSFMG